MKWPRRRRNSAVRRPERAALSLFLFVLLVALAGCGDSTRQQIVGKWRAGGESSGVVWEFFPNGTLTTDGAPGRYSFGDRGRIKVQTRAATFVHQFELDGDRMTWRDPAGARMEFSRLK